MLFLNKLNKGNGHRYILMTKIQRHNMLDLGWLLSLGSFPFEVTKIRMINNNSVIKYRGLIKVFGL